MNILWIPHVGWHVPQRAHTFCRALAERHEVHVTDWVADFSTMRDYWSRRYFLNFTYRQYCDRAIRVHGIPRISPALFSAVLRRCNAAIFSAIVRAIIRRYRIDVVVGSFVVPPPKAPRLVFDLFDENVFSWRARPQTQRYADEIEQVEAAYLREAGAIVAASSVLVDKARSLGAQGPVYHIPNGVDLRCFEHMSLPPQRSLRQRPKPLVGTIGNHNNTNEIDRVLDAAKLLEQNVDVLIAGRGTAITYAQQRVKRDGLTNVTVRGYIPPDAAVEVINSLDVGLCPYDRTPMDDARSPMRLLMYAAAGVPTVCTDLEEVRRMNLPNVVLVPDVRGAFGEGIKMALGRTRARPAQIEQYNLQNLVNKYESVLQG